VLGPLLFGMVCGFLLEATAAGYWVISTVGLLGAVSGGMEHHGAADGARPMSGAWHPRHDADARREAGQVRVQQPVRIRDRAVSRPTTGSDSSGYERRALSQSR